MSDYDSDFDPSSEVYAQTFSAEDQEEARKIIAEHQQQQSSEQQQQQSVSDDWIRSMDGKGHKTRLPGRDNRSSNTGVKGVITDYKDAQKKMRARRLEEKLSAERRLNQGAVGTAKVDDLDELDDSDDEFFQKYKADRFQQIQKQRQSDTPYWGKLEEVSVRNYIEEVEEAPDTHFIVYVEECVRLNFALMTMAERFPYVRFVRGVCTDLIPTFDEIGLPTVMLYRGGKKLDILVRVTDELGANFSDKDLVLYLAKHNILTGAQVDAFLGVVKPSAPSQAKAAHSDDDEDSNSANRRSGISTFQYGTANSYRDMNQHDSDEEINQRTKKVSISRGRGADSEW